MTQRFNLITGASLVLAAHLTPGLAIAADTGATVDQIVVTAQKRAENIQDVPLSIMAMSGDQLAKTGTTDVRDLHGVVLYQHDQVPAVAALSADDAGLPGARRAFVVRGDYAYGMARM